MPEQDTAARRLTGPVRPVIVRLVASPARIDVAVHTRNGDFRLEATPLYAEQPETIWRGRLSGQQRFSIPRNYGTRDLVFSRFRLMGEGDGQASGWMHVTDFTQQSRRFRMPWPRDKKGISLPRMIDDLKQLGVRHATINIVLNGIVRRVEAVRTGEPSIQVDGAIFAINESALAPYDRQVRELTDAGINVVGVICNLMPHSAAHGDPLIHPSSDLANAPTRFGAINTVTQAGVDAYRAVLRVFAERYSRPDRRYGWISSYVVGNEIQAHWTWYNMGRPTEDGFYTDYLKALRIADLVLRDTHPDLRAYISMEHHWSSAVDLRGDDVMDEIAQRARAEGDFPWEVAFHPYPQDLFQPNFMKDNKAVLRWDTPVITFRNLEVLTDYLNQPRLRYRGRRRRVALTEQGFHVTDTPDAELVQAAAYAAAFYRVAHIDGVAAFNYHQHVSSRYDMGLRMGLYEQPGENTPGAPAGRRRPIWEAVYHSGRPGAEARLAYLLPYLGVDDWKTLLPSRHIVRTRATPAFAQDTLIADLTLLVDHARLDAMRNGLEWRRETVFDGVSFHPAIFQHPASSGFSRATLTLKLPEHKPAHSLRLVFSTTLMADSPDGVEWQVEVDGEVLLSGTQTDRRFHEHEAHLTSYAGRTIHLTLGVHPRSNPGQDWFCWVKPAVLMLPLTGQETHR